MPIYEYRCNNCGKKFEVLVFSQSDNKIICVKCGSESTERLFSSFAATSAGKASCAGSGRFS